MEIRNATARFSALALAIASTACAARAQEPASPKPPQPPAPAVQAIEERAATQPLIEKQREIVREQLRDKQRSALDSRMQAEVGRVQAELARAHGDIKSKEVQFNSIFQNIRMSPDQSSIITTETMDAAAQKELREDLAVMDRLVRDEVTRAGADAPSAMGIKITMLGQGAPMYVEGAGAVFSATVNWPLAAAGASAGKKDDRPRDPESKWEIAKREIAGSNLPRRGKPGEPFEPPVFDQARLDALRNNLLTVLPEATNIRHLKPNESVIVTVQGVDEAGYSVRMTLKAAKADVDAAAAGKLSSADFAQRVAQRIG